MKKVISLILSMAMVLSLTVLSFAEPTSCSITIENSTEGHTYEAYQIFTGDVSGKTLSNIKWGSGVTKTDGTVTISGDAATKAESIVNSEAGAKEFAKYLINGNYLTTAAGTASEPIEGKYVIDGLQPGYYLVKEIVKNGDSEEYDAYTDYIVQVLGDVTVQPKTGVPQVEKKVKDINDSTDTTTTDWQDSADYDIGDTVPFQLTGTIGDNYDKFSTYKFVFHDTLSSGLDFNSDSVEVYLVNGGQKTPIVNTDSNKYYEVVTPGVENGCTFEVKFNNLKDVEGVKSGSKIVVEYDATLNTNAVIGSDGNPNKVYLQYSNNPNGEGTGKTPEDTVIVFTYQTVINKKDGANNNQPLAGAAFELQKYNAKTKEWETVKDYKVDNDLTLTQFTFTGLDDGKYKLVETVTPAGYNTIADIEFEITAEHDTNSPDPQLINLNGVETTGQVTLGDGAITFDVVKADGSLTADVINNTGTTLPETGGIGTTIFYIVGAVLVIGAGVLFVTKRRMSAR